MKKTILLLGAMGLLSVTQAQKRPKAIFIGLDGVRSDALIQAETPVMDSIRSSGLYTFNSWHMGRTMSGPSWTTMLTGVWDPKHNVTGNTYSGANWDNFPYITVLAKQIIPDFKSVQVVTWNEFMPTWHPSGKIRDEFFDKHIDAGGAYDMQQVEDAAKIEIMDPEVDFLFVHFDETDATGHAQGFSPQIAPYINALQKIDTHIGRVVAQIKLRPTYDQEEWIVLLTTDHGGIGLGHGGNSNNERRIWWMASGVDVPQLQITGSDPGSYSINPSAIDPQIVKQTPVLADIGVTVLSHLLKYTDVDPETKIDWNLDGKSWLNKPMYIEESSNEDNLFSVYPNPNDGIFNVKLNNSEQNATYQLIDINGKTIKSGSINSVDSNNFDLTSLPNGFYFLKVNQGQKSINRRIIVK